MHCQANPVVPADQGGRADHAIDFQMAWVRQVAADRWLSNRATSVAVVLAEHADPATRTVRLTQQQIADSIHVTDRTVRNVVMSMVRRGHLQVTVRRNRQPNVYGLLNAGGHRHG